MNNGIVGWVAAGSQRLMAQVVVSVVATGCAALIVPQLLTGLGYNRDPVITRQAAVAPVAAPADFDGAFQWPAQTPPAPIETIFVRPQTAQALAPVIAAPVPAPAPRPVTLAHRPNPPRAAAPRPVAVAMPAGEPLQIIPAVATQPAPQPGRSLLGIPVPKLPYEDTMVGALGTARDAVRRLF